MGHLSRGGAVIFRSFAKFWPWMICFAVSIAAALIWAHWPENPLGLKEPVTEVVVLKSKRELILYSGAKLLKAYKVALGKNPVGQKEREGDGKTPEGEYVIVRHNSKSLYHLSLGISYPTKQQVVLAHEKGVSPGGDVMIHGIRRGLGWLGKFHRYIDWTAGCIAVTNEEIEEIYRAVPDGTKITIKP